MLYFGEDQMVEELPVLWDIDEMDVATELLFLDLHVLHGVQLEEG